VHARFKETFQRAQHFEGLSEICTNTSADWTMDSGDVRQEMPAGISSRKRPRAATLLQRAGAETEATTLQAALREIRQLREERQQERDNFEMRLHQREEELFRLEAGVLQRILQQLSPSDNRNNDKSNTENSNGNAVVNELGYKLKPNNFDDTAPLRVLLAIRIDCAGESLE